MTISRLGGIILVGLGVLMTVLAGFWLATEASVLPVGDTLLRALLAFALIIPVILLGVYLLVRSSTQDAEVFVTSEMEQQRRLLDLLKLRGQATFDELAVALDTTEAEIIAQLQSLVHLSIFSGYVQWENGRVVAVPTQSLLNMTHCVHCQQPIHIGPATTTICTTCETEYYTV
ncbi:hypothetical protein G4Y79_14745 [Phototrophicus methaneseepsis]|uniref:Uncharacterized protein n=1 Tax=Phototrophicus methaneseepsis TaxID=2710758 RepID=A0A7S8E631_9CHLR|nr:hypothetical protein [Phototrophicus methaneseepsis]QPC80963.1 hypothetical protein G4Y79_14745 [Phototrophicus methaneseepsis]